MTRIILALAIALAALSGTTPALSAEHVLAIFAHPDDELTVAPYLAAKKRAGAQVTLIIATPGDAGAGSSGLEPGEELAKLRTREAQCSASALKISPPVMLGFHDGDLWQQARNSGDGGSALLAAIRERIAATAPDTIVTWGPDGGYGHADHRMVSAMVTQAVQEIPVEKRPILLYSGIASGTLPPIPQLAGWGETVPDLLTVEVPYEKADLAAAAKAANCHVSQFDPATRAQLAQVLDTTIWRGAVHFRPAFPSRGK